MIPGSGRTSGKSIRWVTPSAAIYRCTIIFWNINQAKTSMFPGAQTFQMPPLSVDSSLPKNCMV